MKPITEQSLYEILEIPRDAAGEDIEKAYQRAKALYGPGSLATYSLVAPEEMSQLDRRIEEARRVLLDPGARAGYDAALPQADGIARVPVRLPGSDPVPPSGIAPAPAAPAAVPQVRAPPAAQGPAVPATAAHGAPAPAAGAAAPRAPGFTVPEGTPWTGEVLRQAREARGLTLSQIAERTKVTRHHLENIEADRYQLLPPPVYLRGILVSLAKELRLDGHKVARSYLEAVKAAEAQKAPPKPH